MVLPVDGRTRIQALGRGRIPLQMKRSHPAVRTRDCRRNGTTCLMMALDVATGKGVRADYGKKAGSGLDFQHGCFPGRAADGIEQGTRLHVIPGNMSSHRSAEVHEWLTSRPDWKFHFTPTSASWMNAVEGFLSKLTRQRLKDAVFDSLEECVAAIDGYTRHHNASDARPLH